MDEITRTKEPARHPNPAAAESADAGWFPGAQQETARPATPYRNRTMTMTPTIAVSNQKGGVAKTTTCLSLGAALAEMGHSVLLIDLDPQANLTLSLGIEPKQLRRTILDTMMGNHSLVSISRETDTFALDIAPANMELTMADKVLFKVQGFQFRLKQAIGRLDPDMYEYILLDCPPTVSPLTLNALAAADLLIIPVQCELYAAHSLRQMIRLALQLREQGNPNLDHRVLITMYDQRNKISRMMLEQMENGLRPVLFNTIIQIDTKLRECPAFGKPITSYAPKSRGALQYRELAQEFQSPAIDRLLRKHKS
jgi:chromosome partitioning protein